MVGAIFTAGNVSSLRVIASVVAHTSSNGRTSGLEGDRHHCGDALPFCAVSFIMQTHNKLIAFTVITSSALFITEVFLFCYMGLRCTQSAYKIYSHQAWLGRVFVLPCASPLLVGGRHVTLPDLALSSCDKSIPAS
uniref:Uncharacterized protein n=1 Tax=Peronospora matthiolae TaxID=2874970 RepID=A0AAV1UV97_9STRA